MLENIRNLADRLLRLPELKGFSGKDFDGPEALRIQRDIFNKKKVSQRMYDEYCRPFIQSALRAPEKSIMVEIGSGVSPLKQRIPSLVCSEVIPKSEKTSL